MSFYQKIFGNLFFVSGQMFAFSLLFSLAILAQEDIIRVETELVAFEVTVTDEKGRPVYNLQEKDFQLFENEKERKIDFFQQLKKTSASRPLLISLAVDISGSISPEELVNLKNALQNFAENLKEYDTYFALTTFGMRVKTLQNFTNKPEKLEKSLDKLLREKDGLSSHAYDAIDFAIRNLQKNAPQTIKGRFPKKVVIVITDGFPVGDIVSPKTVIERANQNETVVYAVILPSYSRLSANKKPLPTPLELSGLLEKTGGQAFYANTKDFSPLLKSLAEEMTASYILAFYPSEENRKSEKFNTVKIRVSSGFQLRQNREGYQLKKEK